MSTERRRIERIAEPVDVDRLLAIALEGELADYVDLVEDGWARQAARACVEVVRLCGWTPPSAEPVDVDLVALRRVAEAATPGPWHLETPHEGWSVDASDGLVVHGPRREAFGENCWTSRITPAGGEAGDDGIAIPDAEHIAAFDPPTVLALLDRLEEAEAKVARVEALADRMDASRWIFRPHVSSHTMPPRLPSADLREALSGDLTASEGGGGPEAHREPPLRYSGPAGYREGVERARAAYEAAFDEVGSLDPSDPQEAASRFHRDDDNAGERRGAREEGL